jgi:hypothetical protein
LVFLLIIKKEEAMITSKWKNIRNESQLLQLAAIEANCADLSTATAYSRV